jgi:hypothetical protein
MRALDMVVVLTSRPASWV